MKLFSRNKSEAPAAPAPKPTRKGVTYAELNGAINAASAEMADCTTRRTLQALDMLMLTDDAADSDIVKLNGPAPVSLTQFDEALSDLDNYEMPANTLAPLKRLRALIANAETLEAKTTGVPVTRAEFDALVEAVSILVLNIDAAQDRKGYPDGRISNRLETVIAASGELKVSSAVASMLQKITGQISVASENAGTRDRKRAGSRLNIVPGGGGRPNY